MFMGYTHGKKWSHEDMKNEVYKVMKCLNIDRMPSSVECNRVTGNTRLSNVINRRGGFDWLANHLGLKQSKCETRLGRNTEIKVKEILEEKGYEVKQMGIKHPYDLLVNGNIKIDVKASHKYQSEEGWSSYSFNLEKENPTCDIYIAVCINEKNDFERILVIPSKFLNQTQLCITGAKSKYDIYKDRWDYIEQYNEFYSNII